MTTNKHYLRLPASNTVIQRNSPVSPLPRKKISEDTAVVDDMLSDHISIEIEAGDEWSYTQPGMSHQTLKRLRRGHWRIQQTLDLHGCAGCGKIPRQFKRLTHEG